MMPKKSTLRLALACVTGVHSYLYGTLQTDHKPLFNEWYLSSRWAWKLETSRLWVHHCSMQMLRASAGYCNSIRLAGNCSHDEWFKWFPQKIFLSWRNETLYCHEFTNSRRNMWWGTTEHRKDVWSRVVIPIKVQKPILAHRTPWFGRQVWIVISKTVCRAQRSTPPWFCRPRVKCFSPIQNGLVHGIPESMVSDNGPQFVAHEFELFCKRNGIKNGIKHIRVTSGGKSCSNWKYPQTTTGAEWRPLRSRLSLLHQHQLQRIVIGFCATEGSGLIREKSVVQSRKFGVRSSRSENEVESDPSAYWPITRTRSKSTCGWC